MRFRPGQHLRRQSDIRAVREQGRRVDGRAFTVWWRDRTQGVASEVKSEKPRAAVIASIAAVGPAVRRNRAKRRLRELFRKHQSLIPPECDLLLIARAQAVQWRFADLERTFVDACRRIAPSPSATRATLPSAHD
jgi:ribonuclease P protein component